jgi:5-methylcytosine-specific restriction protein A
VSPGEEAKKFRWHRRAERNPRLAKQAKTYHGVTCKVCGFNFEEAYGPHGQGYIEAHHLVSFSTLSARPDTVILDPKTDFTVVCADCHRMLHRKPAPSLDALGTMLRAASTPPET